MPSDHDVLRADPVRRSRLVRDLRALGLQQGALVMVHASLGSLRWVVGGAETVVHALLEVVGPHGTVAAVASWDDIPFRLDRWPPEWRDAYLEEMPGFDADLSEANRLYGRLPERLRTWPGACRSAHPDQRVVAVGRLAEPLTRDHPLDDSFGPRSPFARLAAWHGQVLMLGAPLRSLTLLHHAEAIAAVPGKRRWSYRLPFAEDGETRWRMLHDIDVDLGPLPYGGDPLDGLATIAADALAAGVGRSGAVAAARCHLFPAGPLVSFARAWLEERFGAAAASERATPTRARASGPRRSRAGTRTPPR